MNFKYFKITSLIPLILILSLVFQPISNWIEKSLSKYDEISGIVGYIDSFSTIGMITLILTFINFVGWKWNIFKWLIDVPNLNGRYQGQLISSYEISGVPVIKDCVLEIKQTASNVHVYAYYGNITTGEISSRSFTTSEQLVKEANGLFLLYYIFTNEPETLSVQLNNHDGTAKFKYFPDIKTLDGEYYNKRANIGTIKVKFMSKNIIGRLIP